MRAVGVSLIALGLLACGGAARSQDKELAEVREATLKREIVSLKRRLEAAQRENDALRQRLSVAEQRAGMVPFRPETLKPLEHGTLALGSATLVSEEGARGRRQKIDNAIGPRRGTVVAFWATWCKPCTTPEELAHLKHLQGALRHVNGALVSMAVDGLDDVKSDPRASQWVYPLWQQKDAHIKRTPQSLIEEAGIGLPLFLVVDAAGQVRWWRNAPLDDAVIEELITAVARM